GDIDIDQYLERLGIRRFERQQDAEEIAEHRAEYDGDGRQFHGEDETTEKRRPVLEDQRELPVIDHVGVSSQCRPTTPRPMLASGSPTMMLRVASALRSASARSAAPTAAAGAGANSLHSAGSRRLPTASIVMLDGNPL